jgi:hypothetical protein
VATIHTQDEEPVDRAVMKAEQDTDAFCKKVRSHLDTLPEYMEDRDELLYRKGPRGKLKLVIPKSLVTKIIRQHHDSRYAAHAGIRKTQQWLREKILLV